MRIAFIGIWVVAGGMAFGQAAQSKLTFEVASVRPSNRPNALPRGAAVRVAAMTRNAFISKACPPNGFVAKKLAIDVVVIDDLEKSPTEN